MRKLELHWQILIAIILAGLVGGWVFNSHEATGVEPTIAGVQFVTIFNYIGTMFLNALKMIIVPLIMSSIIVGVAGIGSGGDLGALGGKTLLFYATTTLAAMWRSAALNSIRQNHLRGSFPADSPCARCDYPRAIEP